MLAFYSCGMSRWGPVLLLGGNGGGEAGALQPAPCQRCSLPPTICLDAAGRARGHKPPVAAAGCRAGRRGLRHLAQRRAGGRRHRGAAGCRAARPAQVGPGGWRAAGRGPGGDAGPGRRAHFHRQAGRLGVACVKRTSPARLFWFPSASSMQRPLAVPLCIVAHPPMWRHARLLQARNGRRRACTRTMPPRPQWHASCTAPAACWSFLATAWSRPRCVPERTAMPRPDAHLPAATPGIAADGAPDGCRRWHGTSSLPARGAPSLQARRRAPGMCGMLPLCCR